METSSTEISWRRGFWALVTTQFQSAASDNAYKFLIIFLIAASDLPRERRDLLIPLVAALFALPFVLFSMLGGYLADRYSKRSVAIAAKAGEVAMTVVAAAGLASGSLPLQLTAMFLVSTAAALFSPAKYGLLPEILPAKLLSWGNGIVSLGTFVASIAGTIGGAWLAAGFAGRQWITGLLLVGTSLIGLAVSFAIDGRPAADPGRRFRFNFLADLAAEWREIRRDRVLALAMVGSTYFFFLAALLQLAVVSYGTDILGLGPDRHGWLQAALALGIGFGSLAAGYLSGHKIEYGLIPLGSIGITVFGLLLYQPELGLAGMSIDLAFLGFFGGFFIVPVNALLQHRPAPERKGAVIAVSNFLAFVAIFLAAGVNYLLAGPLGLEAPSIFLWSSLLTLGATVYVIALLPDALLRLILWFATHTVYRIRVEGRNNVPEKGGALFVSNHLSFVDALLLLASTDRRIRFIMHQDFYERRLIRPFARMMEAIPISSKFRPRDMLRSLRRASEALQAGRVVCIFAEGQITRTGQILPFRRGMERIMKGVSAPIIPVHLDGIWGSIFSFERGRFFWKLPRRVPYTVTVSLGRPLPSTASPFEVRQAVQELGSEAYLHRAAKMLPLSRAFIRAARRHPFRFAMADGSGELRAGTVLARAIYLARRLEPVWRGQEMVGILLPPSLGGALVNIAALLSGKVPVNLNYTVSNATLESCARQCALETVVTSRTFLERVPVEPPARAVWIEEMAAAPRLSERLAALAIAGFFPPSLLERAVGRRGHPRVDDLATVIFSSGSTGDPKGVMLTHRNVGANLEQLGQVFALSARDRLLGILPFFHSFGFTGTLALPLALGVGVVYHPNPFDAGSIGALVRRHAVTFLLATPTFLQTYMRRIDPEDFGSLEYVLVGAEKLQERVATAFEDRFGIRPLEAYGCTECAPAVTVNTRDFRAAGFRQVGGKRGKIGHPLPSVSVRIVDPSTFEPRGVDEPGLLLVRGPNVMKGYLGQPEKTSEVLRDGWYITGDIAAVDEDGFLSITDRLSRFSKIGGEMVPHVHVEEKLHELSETTDQSFAVVGVPDDRKGERLVVLHTLPEERLVACLEKLAQSDLPNLWIPRAGAFFRIKALPYLGTGKLDLRRIRELALEFSAKAE